MVSKQINEARRKKNGIVAKLLSLIFGRTILVLCSLFILGMVIFLAVFWYQSISLNKTNALQEAVQLADALTEFRTLYTSQVVVRAKQSGMKITHDYHNYKNAIPLPATLSMELGQKIGDKNTGAKSLLYSKYPFPWRKKTGGLRDEFQKAAWEQLNKHPNKPFYRFEKYNKVDSLRYATADLMRKSCIECHNKHKQTPKNNWKINQVRGVLEVIIPMYKAAEKTQENLFTMILLMVVMGGFGLGGLSLVIGKLRRISKELEQKVDERTISLKNSNELLEVEKQSVSNLLNSMNQAVFAINASCRVIPPVSRHSQQVFYTSLEDRDIFELLYNRIDIEKDDYSKVETALAIVFGEDELQWDMVEENLPRRVIYKTPDQDADETRRVFRVLHTPIWDSDENLDKILYVIEDVTTIERLELELTRQKKAVSKNILILQELAESDLTMLKNFFGQSKEALEQAKLLGNELLFEASHIHELFRYLHTLKGNSRLLQLSLIIAVVHDTESKVLKLRDQYNQGESLDQEQIHIVIKSMDEICSQLSEYSLLAQKIFNIEDKSLSSDISAPKMLDVTEEKLVKLQELCSSLHDNLPPKIVKAVESLTEIPIETIVSRFSSMIDTTSLSLGKKVEFMVNGGDIFFARNKLYVLQDILLHLLQNAVDHGIENEQERLATDKKEVACITLSFKLLGEKKLVVEIKDDGRGIDTKQIIEKSIAEGVITKKSAKKLSEEEKLALIFRPGISTAQDVTELSGRGVGMDAVNACKEQLGASLSVSSEKGKGTCFTINIPK